MVTTLRAVRICFFCYNQDVPVISPRTVEAKYLIYMHTAPNGKSYIGQTCNLHRRNIVHKNTDGCRAFSNAIKKYGWDNLTHTILAEGLTLEEANALEVALISQHNTISPNGYNLKSGGRNGEPSKESIELAASKRRGRKLTEAQRTRLSELGKGMSPERMKKLQEGAEAARERIKGKPHFNLGRKHDEQHKQKTSQATKERWADPQYRAKVIASKTGTTRSPETKAKQAAAARARWERHRIEKEAAQGDLPPSKLSA